MHSINITYSDVDYNEARSGCYLNFIETKQNVCSRNLLKPIVCIGRNSFAPLIIYYCTFTQKTIRVNVAKMYINITSIYCVHITLSTYLDSI